MHQLTGRKVTKLKSAHYWTPIFDATWTLDVILEEIRAALSFQNQHVDSTPIQLNNAGDCGPFDIIEVGGRDIDRKIRSRCSFDVFGAFAGFASIGLVFVLLQRDTVLADAYFEVVDPHF